MMLKEVTHAFSPTEAKAWGEEIRSQKRKDKIQGARVMLNLLTQRQLGGVTEIDLGDFIPSSWELCQITRDELDVLLQEYVDAGWQLTWGKKRSEGFCWPFYREWIDNNVFTLTPKEAM